MGVNNRDRRKAKKKDRDAKRRTNPSAAPRQLSAAEAADMFIDTAVHAFSHGDDARGEEVARTLAELPGTGGLLLEYLQEAVGEVWKAGWQPADLARAAARRLGSIHERLMVDVIAGRMRQFAPSRVDPRWDEQLRGLGAVVWWEHDERHLERWTAREAIDRSTAICTMLKVLALLGMLPEIPVLCPVPGTGHHMVKTGPAPDPRVLHKVRALLAKAESTEFPEEAEALTAKAQEMIARHSIDSALLAATTTAMSSDQPHGRRVGLDAPYEAEKMSLLQEVAEANRCRTVWSNQLSFATVFGYETDIVAVELLFTSLLVQATAAMTRAGSKRRVTGESRTRSFRQSFLSAYAHRIGQRLREVTDEATRSTTDSDKLLPVLAARGETVTATIAAHYPSLTYRPVKGGRDREGWASGTAAADQAIITRARTSVTAPGS